MAENSLYLRVFLREKDIKDKFLSGMEKSLLEFYPEYLKVLIKQFHRDYIINKKQLPEITIIDNKNKNKKDFLEIRTELNSNSLIAFNEIRQSLKSLKVIKEKMIKEKEEGTEKLISKRKQITEELKGKKIQNTHIILYIIKSILG